MCVPFETKVDRHFFPQKEGDNGSHSFEQRPSIRGVKLLHIVIKAWMAMMDVNMSKMDINMAMMDVNITIMDININTLVTDNSPTMFRGSSTITSGMVPKKQNE